MQNLWDNMAESIAPWFADYGWQILAILLAAFFITKFNRIIITSIVRRVVISKKFSSKESEEKRENTLIAVFDNTIKIIVWFVAFIVVFSALKINTTSLIAGAGFFGLAFGFGAQYLIRDIISGFFILIEDQYRVGDVVTLNGVSGTVEEINLRTTILRDMDGTVHHIPNGTITKTANMTRTFSVINMNIGVSYNEDIEKVAKVINKVGEKMIKDEKWESVIKEAPKFVRINEFGDSAVILRVSCKTKPAKQWEVGGEIRKRIKEAFDREKIEIPYPHMVVKNKK